MEEEVERIGEGELVERAFVLQIPSELEEEEEVERERIGEGELVERAFVLQIPSEYVVETEVEVDAVEVEEEEVVAMAVELNIRPLAD